MSGSDERSYLVDTNIFLRILVKDEEKSFYECVEFVKWIKAGQIRATTSTLVLAEIHWTLSSFYQFPKEKVAQALGSIINLKNLKIIDKYNHMVALGLFEQKNVKFIDCLIASSPMILKRQAVVVSFDRDFDKLGISRKEPGKIVKES
ncbi:MAG: hypothetical protein A2Z24_02030 [Candidatus Woykebacteria bacterium RBG_16_44_10]|uniref:PIN domain-containing protein n=1 Tax=Candidatus Woykebacteria bacterium RBG_16_44_10 TaxID=1802597 RepID=A0A1G1WF50_9BACT|nr:MAG: hypothetical protein A2Z24_02030 [Candidatus Woykebacteria bacterium RBG_16_44_10]